MKAPMYPPLVRAAKRILMGALSLALGRRNIVRLGRFLSNEGRLDLLNEIDRNGENLVQRAALQQAPTGADVVIFDVGANVGEWTRNLLSEPLPGARPKIHLFEPCETTFQTLVSNLALWGLGDSTIASNAALSSRDGHGTLFSVGPNQGTNSIYETAAGNKPSPEEITLEQCDSYCGRNGIQHIDLLKIDTEGHDMEVILGASNLLQARQIDIVQFEYNWRWVFARHFLRDAFAVFLPWDYCIGKVTPQGIEFYDDWHFELETFREGNYLAVKREFRMRFPQVKWWNA
jgi:FkbM family methyltransferase